MENVADIPLADNDMVEDMQEEENDFLEIAATQTNRQ